MDILRLLDELNHLAVEQPHQIMGSPLYWGLNTDEISMQIAKVRASLPQDVKVAANTARESQRIIEGAREDATMTLENSRKEAERIIEEARGESLRILEQARLEQLRMVSESEILKLTKAQSEEIRNAADRDSIQMRRGADKYAYDVLTQMETVVGKVMTTIERGKIEMTRPEPTHAAVAPSRERTRV